MPDGTTPTPNPLPKTLPTGTRIKGAFGIIATSELTLDTADVYLGSFASAAGAQCPSRRCAAMFIDWSSVAALRSQPAPVPPTEGEFKVGDRVAGHCVRVDECGGPFDLEGTYRRLDSIGRHSVWGIGCDRAGQRETFEREWFVTADSLRRLSASTPSATATAAPVAKADPYKRADHLTDDEIAERTKRHVARRSRFTADQIGSIDLNRPLTPPRYPSRYVCVGVMGDGAPVKRREVKGAPSTWPEGSDHE